MKILIAKSHLWASLVVAVIPAISSSELSQKFNGQWENDCWILLSWDVGQRLQVTQLQGRWRLGNDVRGFFESSGSLLFSFCCYDLCSGLSGGFSFCSHGTLKLLWQSDIFNLDSFDLGKKQNWFKKVLQMGVYIFIFCSKKVDGVRLTDSETMKNKQKNRTYTFYCREAVALIP